MAVVEPGRYQPGDLVFCHSRGIVSRAIRIAQRLRSPRADAQWNHVAILYRRAAGGDWYVLQAEGHGVTGFRALSDIAPGGKFEVVKCPASAHPDSVIGFARTQIGAHYGFLTVASIVLNLLTPKWIALRKPGTLICSALAAEALMYAGWPVSARWDDIYQVTPAELYERV